LLSPKRAIQNKKSKLKKKFTVANLVLFIFGIRFTHGSCASCKKKSPKLEAFTVLWYRKKYDFANYSGPACFFAACGNNKYDTVVQGLKIFQD
jgi:hypothetical protein